MEEVETQGNCNCGCGCGADLAYRAGGIVCADCDELVCMDCCIYDEVEDEIECHECAQED